MSGLFTLVSTLLVTVIGDSSQNNWFGGEPRANITFPNGPGSEPALGPVLTGAALANANTLRNFYQARIFWLGNDILANKYGTTPPEEMTPVETEMWARQVAVLEFTVARINALLGDPMGLTLRNALRKKPDAEKPDAVPEKKPDAAPEKKPDAGPVMSLTQRYEVASEQERAELMMKVLGIGAQT